MARDYQKVGFDSPTPPPAADFPVLVLKWDGMSCVTKTTFKRTFTHLLEVKVHRKAPCTCSLTDCIQKVILRHIQTTAAEVFSM